MQTPRQDKSYLNVLDVDVYVADWENKKWLTYLTKETQKPTFYLLWRFGPFYIKEKRSELKKYGAIFLCLASRAVQIEMTHQTDTDSFIQVLQRMIAKRGNVRLIQSDNGSNFLGAESELKRTFLEIDNTKISQFLQGKITDRIMWQRNTPAASHMGGVWEQQIRPERSILLSLLKTHSQSLNDKSFPTLMAEVEGITNSRPLTVETLSDVSGYKPLSPSD